jgi:hypothetical protein
MKQLLFIFVGDLTCGEGNIELFGITCAFDEITIEVPAECNSEDFVKAFDWDLSFFDEKGEDFVSPNEVCKGVENLTTKIRTYSIPIAKNAGSAASCNMNMANSVEKYCDDCEFVVNYDERVYSMAFNFMINKK